MRSLIRETCNYNFSSKESINEADWQALLKHIKPECYFPEDYKEFLFKYNGGRFKECIIPKSLEGPLIVSLFYPYDEVAELSLNTLIEYSEDDIENGFFPIADDPGGNYYLLNINQEGNGEVYYWSHDSVFENGTDKILIFNSFTDFINTLEVDI